MKGFFERASCPREKRRTSMCGALRVCRHRQGRLEPWKLKATATATARVTLPAAPTRACGSSGAPTSWVHDRCRLRRPARAGQHGRASSGERVCRYVEIPGVDVSLKKKTTQK